MNLQNDQNSILPVPLCISDAASWLTLWKAELAWSAITLPFNIPNIKTETPPDEPEKPHGEE